MSTDAEWERWGQTDPYFAVRTDPKFRSKNLTEEAKAEFFESGRQEIDRVFGTIRQRIDGSFAPKRALDFGCGTGRLVIPLARVVKDVTGADVSDAMLRESRANCDTLGIENVSLVKSDDELLAVGGPFDFIHSFIVFQHIPVDRGRKLFGGLLGLLAEDGICAVQLTYAKAAFAQTYGDPTQVRESLMRRLGKRVRRQVRRALVASKQAIMPKPEEPSDPEMQMNPYRLNDLFFLIQSMGARSVYVELTDHAGELGVYLYFQKPLKS